MQTKALNYCIIVTPDTQTDTNKPGFTAYSPLLGVADDGDTIEEAIGNVTKAIKVYIESLAEDDEPIPTDRLNRDIITSTEVDVPQNFPVLY